MRRLPRLLSSMLLAAAVSPALAAADVVPPPTVAPLVPAPAPAPAPMTIRTGFENPGGAPVHAVIAGGKVRVVGAVRPYIAGQTVFVRTLRRGMELEARAVPVASAGNGLGRFVALIGVGGRPATVSV
ncbi:MAG: hypothetical protein QOE44_137, partial [Solirubrobacteraceae bacterium]|nr:hypothetical protein [Solirubrobacteraceae bacterium]